VILGLAVSLAAGTILESKFDTPTAQYWVYRSFWFYSVLTLLGLNIFAVMVDRWPWKRRHMPFLLAHIGILLLLYGSWVTYKYGLDGSMRINEGETSSIVEVSNPTLILSDGKEVQSVPVRWTPPNAKFAPVAIEKYGLTIDQFLAHADPVISFTQGDPNDPDLRPAVKLEIVGGPMQIHQQYWLWAGDAAWSQVQAGPARLTLLPTSQMLSELPKNTEGQPWLILAVDPHGALTYTSYSSSGQKKTGRIAFSKATNAVIDPGWRGNVRITVQQFIPQAVNTTTYSASKALYGTDAPPSAIHVVAGKGGSGSELWLGLGDRGLLQFAGRAISIGYNNQRYVLPFSIRLDRFNIDHYEGTADPMQFSSKVSVVDNKNPGDGIVISMNEPLVHSGITFYQSSYEEAMPRPTVSIFSVNRDPGRKIKYVGSILIVFGIILLFARNYMRARGSRTRREVPAV
jgi:hypothetical protein